MFEKVTCSRAERRAVLQLRGVSAAVAAHAVCVVSITALSLAAPAPDEPAEEATYLLLHTPTFADLPAVRPRSDRPARPAPAALLPREATEKTAPPVREAERLALRMAERALAEPTLNLGEIPPSGPALDAALMRGLGDLGPGGDTSGSMLLAEGGGAPLVDGDVLATPPQMLNRRLVRRLLSEDYPSGLMWRGIEGEVVVAFIIGVDGRAEMNHVEVLSATNDGFIAAALQGIRRMRFRPAELDGRRVRVRVSIPFVWQLPKTR